MELKSNNVVVLNNGHVGIVVEFNNKPSYIMTKAYCRRLSQYDADGKTSKDDYSIAAVYDASSVSNAEDVFKSNFKVENLTKLS